MIVPTDARRKQEQETLTDRFGEALHLTGPVVLGLGACFGFYALIFNGPFDVPLARRYFAGHPVAYVATMMFFIGVVALAMKLWSVLHQLSTVGAAHLGPAPRGGNSPDQCDSLLEKLDQLPSRMASGYLAARLRRMIVKIQRKGTPSGLEEDLNYQSELDSIRQHDSYALVRILIWATPMLGFLGTVIGITRALGDMDFSQMANSLQDAMQGLLSGLYVAFDTTALALSLSIVLMFLQFLVERMETQLLGRVDARAELELLGRFQELGGPRDPHLASIQRMSEAVVASTERVVRRQAELWQATIDEAHERWSSLTDTAGDRLHAALSEALDDTLRSHMAQLGGLLEAAQGHARLQWQLLDERLAQHAHRMDQQQAALVEQGQLMSRAIHATGDIVNLERALNDNLAALAGSQNFEETVISLSAAISLLNTRLGGEPQTKVRRGLFSRARDDERAA